MASHIALFLPDLEFGGAERVNVDLCQGFINQGLRVDLVLVKARGAYLSRVHPQVRVIDLNAANTYASLPRLTRYLRQERPQVLSPALDLTNMVALLARRISGVPTRVVIQIHNTVSLQPRSAWKKKLERLLMKRLYPWSDEIVIVSRSAATDFTQYTGIGPQHIHVIYPIITPAQQDLIRQPLDHPWFLPGEPPVILGIGRLTRQKDFATLVRAFSIVRKIRDCRLMILGEGEERAGLQALVETLGLSSDVSMPGFVNNPYQFLHKASVFVLSSLWEGLPSVLIEALACGCPVVSTDCPSGPSETLDGGKYGRLVPVGNAEAMAQAICDVLNGDALRAPASWLEQFELATVVRQYLQVMGLPESRLTDTIPGGLADGQFPES